MNADETQMNAEKKGEFFRAHRGCVRNFDETPLCLIRVHLRFICVHLRFQAFRPHNSRT